MASASTKFSVTLSPVGVGRCVIDQAGEALDVSEHVAAGALHFGDGKPTVLTLHETGSGRIEGEGIVRVVEQAEDIGALIAGWLEHLDPDELHRVAMQGLDASTSVSGAYLATLKRWARGEQ